MNSLTPDTETPFVRSLCAPSARLDDILAPTREVWNPWDCLPEFLKSLAHAYSVDLWSDDWTDLKKRSIIAHAVIMHFLKGTLKGLDLYLSYTPGRRVSLVRPPQKVFSGAALSKAEREAWLAGLPQVRVWFTNEHGTRGNRVFSASGRNPRSKCFRETSFLQPSRAMLLLRRRARWVVGGAETDTRVSDFGGYFRLHPKGAAGSKVFCNRTVHGKFFQPSTAGERLITIMPTSLTPWRIPVSSSLAPVTAEPELIRERGRAGSRVFTGGFIGKGFLCPSRAWRLLYKRWAIAQGYHMVKRPVIQFMNVGRYSFPAHTAYVRISAPGKRSKYAAGEGIASPKIKFWIPHDGSRMRLVAEAVRASKRESDRIMYYTGWRPRIVAGAESFIAGTDTFIVGRPTKEQVYGK
jgi:hypothetical protein